MLEDRFAKYHPSSYQEWIDIPGLSHIYRSLESQQSLKCWNLKTFRMKKCLEDTNIKSTIQTFDLVCFPEGEQLSWTIILSNFEKGDYDVLIWYLANSIKMNSLHTYIHFCFLLIIFFFLSKMNLSQRYASGSFCDVPVSLKKGEVIKF